MKILRVKGENLASLESFDVELHQGPLAQSGVFAITGPTGAGKTTILDAICLALYNETPRMNGRSSISVGRADDVERLGDTDVRSLLRRGAGAGYAEVEFIGSDHKHYRARWSIRRARELATGRVQKQQVELYDAKTDKSLTGSHNKETLEIIQERLGLSFEQFRRSVLLAQGDFAAFLKANAKERADLLERMTGTEIYSQLSIAAFERAKEKQRDVDALHNELAALNILTPEERTAAENDIKNTEEALKPAQKQLEASENELRWYENERKLREVVQETLLRKEQAQQAWDNTESQRKIMHQVEALQVLRPRVEAYDSALTQVQNQQKLLDSSTVELQAAHATLEAATEKLQVCTQEKTRADDALKELTPKLKAAEKLDVRLAEAQKIIQKTAQETKHAEKELKETQRAVEELNKMLKSRQEELKDAQDWLDAHTDSQPLAEQWERWKRLLERYEKASRLAHQLDGERASLQEALDTTQTCVRDAKKAQETALAARKDANTGVERARQKVAAFDRAALRRERETLESYKSFIQSRKTLALEAAKHVEDIAKLERRVQQEEKNASQAEESARGLQREYEKESAKLDEAKRHQKFVQSQRSLMTYRAELKEGCPCPLCGATEHPGASDEHVIDSLVAEAESRIASLESALKQLTEQIATAKKSTEVHAARAQDAKKELTTVHERLEFLQGEWAQAKNSQKTPHGTQELPDEVVNECVITALATWFQRVEEDTESLQIREKEADLAQKALDETQKQLAGAQNALDETEEALRSAEARFHTMNQQLSELKQELTTHKKGILETQNELAEVFVSRENWQHTLQTNATAFLTACQKEVDAWRHKLSTREATKEAIQALQPRLERARAQLESHEKLWQAQHSELTTLRESKCELEQERRTYFDGRSTEEVYRELQQRCERALNAQKTAEQSVAQATHDRTARATRLDEGKRALQEKKTSLETAKMTLDNALQEQQVTLDEVRALFDQYSTQWLSAQKSAVEQARKNLDNAVAILKERQQELETHHKETKSPVQSFEELTLEVGESKKQVEELKEQLTRKRVVIETDNARRDNAKALQAPLEKATEIAKLWSSLSDLIGSSDGTKFRRFAQSLTLEALIQEANNHLKELAPRYALERVHGEDLDLQVIDLDMGEDVRSINSLSGGETFLVSLALALGLSSISTHNTNIESLFIDEGFGTLDMETLEIAIATLDSLQSRGCQVGIISHVQGLAERIGAQIRVTPTGSGRSMVEVI